MSLSQVKKVRASLIELWDRTIKLVKNDNHKDVYWNGEDNQYPSEIRRVVANSPTASRASKVMAKYIGGKGVRSEGKTESEVDIIVNDRKNYKLSNVASFIANNLSEQGGCWIWVGYGFNDDAQLVPKQLDVLNYEKCRKQKEDDAGYDGRIYYKDFCEKKTHRGKKTEDKWYYPFNSNPDVVKAQIKADYDGEIVTDQDFLTALKHYRGQVYYLNLTPQYEYAVAPVDSVYNDADSEYRISLYTNMQVRSGFLGKTAVLTQGLEEEQEEDIKKDILNWLGSENSDSVYFMSVASADKLDEVLKVIQVKGQYDEKMFTETNTRLRKNILGAFNNIPEPLLFAGEGALFGTNAYTYEQMKLFYSEQTEDERWKLSEALTFLGFPCEIKPIVELTQTITKTEDATA